MNCNEKTSRNRGEQGYVLLVFILFSALLMVSLSMIIPKAVFEGQRDKEEELIFRGLQYQRAIQLFVRKVHRYPTSVDELVKTNGIRFLRKRYKDPMTKEGEWRLIHLGPNGVFVDSLTSASAPPLAGASPAGTPAGQGTTPGNSTTPQPGSTSSQTTSFSQLASTSQSTSASQPTTISQPLSGGPSFGGGPIAGFASQSKAESIKVVKGYDEYDKWEFVYDYRQDPLGAAAIGGTLGQQQPPPQQPQQPAQTQQQQTQQQIQSLQAQIQQLQQQMQVLSPQNQGPIQAQIQQLQQQIQNLQQQQQSAPGGPTQQPGFPGTQPVPLPQQPRFPTSPIQGGFPPPAQH